MKVRITTIESGMLDLTEEWEFDDFDAAVEFVDSLEFDGLVGCIKDGDRIRRVF